MRIVERKILIKINGRIADEITDQYGIKTNEELERLYSQPSLRWAGHVLRAQDDRLVKRILKENPAGQIHVGRPRHRWRNNTMKDLMSWEYKSIKMWGTVVNLGKSYMQQNFTTDCKTTEKERKHNIAKQAPTN